jgi:hypothetical protein
MEYNFVFFLFVDNSGNQPSAKQTTAPYILREINLAKNT